MKIKYLLYSVLTTAVLSGCIDVLDKKDLSAITEKDVWNNANMPPPILTNCIVTTFRDGIRT